MFQTITTIGFGDVIAGVDYSGDWCEGVEIGFHFTNFFWVNICKNIFNPVIDSIIKTGCS